MTQIAYADYLQALMSLDRSTTLTNQFLQLLSALETIQQQKIALASAQQSGLLDFLIKWAGRSAQLSNWGGPTRILVKIKEVLDLNSFTGVWRGRIFFCRAFPSTANLAVGDLVIVTRLNSTEYFYWEVLSGLPYGLIIIWSGIRANVPTHWQYCDGSGPTPDLRMAFVVGAGGTYPIGDVGGDDTAWMYHTHNLDAGISITSTGSGHWHWWKPGNTGPGSAGNVNGAGVGTVGAAHTHTIADVQTSSDTHTHNWASFLWPTGGPNEAPDNRPLYRAFPYIMHIDTEGDIPVGGIINWSGSLAALPAGYALCDGSGGTIDLHDRFVVCEDDWAYYAHGESGGSDAKDMAHDHNPPTFGGGWKFDLTQTHPHTITHATGANAATRAVNVAAVLADRYDGGSHSHDIIKTLGSGNHDHNLSGVTGSGLGAEENRPPFYALAFIQRIA